MSGKSRQLGLTFVAGALGVGVVLLGRGEDFTLRFNIMEYNINLHITVVLFLVAIIALYAVRGLDVNVYHKMLRGAVTFGEDFEQNYMKKIFDLDKGMTQSISHFSRYSDAAATMDENGRQRYSGKKRKSAENKIKAFYRNTATFLFFGAVILLAYPVDADTH